MTVPTLTDENAYTGAGTTDTYAYSYRIFQDSDLLVTQTALDGTVSTLVLTTDYTVDGVLSYTGGTITLTAGSLGSGVGLVITRAPEAVQDTSLQSQGAYDAKTVENALDLLTMICQYLQNQVSRALVVPPGTTPISLPDPSALDLLQWNAAADGLQNLSLADLSPLLLSGNFVVDRPTFTAGVSTTVTLTQAPGTVNNTLVAFDGVYQQKNTYSVSSTTLTFDAAIPLGVLSVEVTQSAVLPLAIPADNSVGTAAYQTGSITAAKIAAATITGDKVLPGTLTQSLLATGLGYVRNWLTDGQALLANGLDYVASVSGTFSYGKSDLCKGALAGTAVAGTLTQGTGSSLGITGKTFKWSAVTTTGSGLAKWRLFIESADATEIANQTMSLRVACRHDAGVSINYTLNVYKANAADNFAAVTAIRAGTPTAVATATNVNVDEVAIAMGSCGNGVMVEVVATLGAVTNKNFEIADLSFVISSTVVTSQAIRYADLVQYGLRFYERLGGSSGDPVGTGQVFNTTTDIVFFGPCARKRIDPTYTFDDITKFSIQDQAGTNTPLISGGSGGYGGPNFAGNGVVAASIPGPLIIFPNAVSGFLRIDARF